MSPWWMTKQCDSLYNIIIASSIVFICFCFTIQSTVWGKLIEGLSQHTSQWPFLKVKVSTVTELSSRRVVNDISSFGQQTSIRSLWQAVLESQVLDWDRFETVCSVLLYFFINLYRWCFAICCFDISSLAQTLRIQCSFEVNGPRTTISDDVLLLRIDNHHIWLDQNSRNFELSVITFHWLLSHISALPILSQLLS